MKKILFLISFLLIFSGCTVDYNITIKNDNSVIETAEINGQKVNNKEEFNKIKSAINNEFKSVLDKYNYSYNISNTNNKINFELSKNSDMDSLFNDSLYNELFEDSEFFNNNNKWYFTTVGSNYTSELFITKNYEEDMVFQKSIDTLRINITFEGNVIESNADKVDKKTNTYTWIFDKDNHDKSIEFSYSNSLDNNVTKKQVKKKKDNKKNTISTKFIIIVMGLLGLGIIIIIIFAVIQNSNVNKI